MYHLYCYIPESHLESVKRALFAAGAGKIGDYDCCAWQTKGQGQFRPLAGSQPFLGQQNVVETAEEYKVEMVCDDDKIFAVIAALKQAHPYEEPAYGFWKINEFP